MLSRRRCIQIGALAAVAACARLREGDRSSAGAPQTPSPRDPPDHTIRIGNGLVELGPDAVLSTRLYNGQFPGPLLRLREGKPVVVDVYNDTDTPEQLHWHGQTIPAEVDGAAEEGSPYIPPQGMRRIAFTPAPAGFRFYHTHVTAGSDLTAGLYNGQAGLVFVEPGENPSAYDQEVFLTLKEFGPYFRRMDKMRDFLAPAGRDPDLVKASEAAMLAAIKQGRQPGYQLGYNFLSINGRMLGSGDPIRVEAGQRVLFHILNASATETRGLALPGHDFRVVALDGNPVPRPAAVPALWLGPAERISAIVEMNNPGVWVMGEVADDDRNRGMGVVVKYANQIIKPRWVPPEPFRWDYRLFGERATASKPEETIEMIFASRPGTRAGLDEFTINDRSFAMDEMEPRFSLVHGRRYRLRMRNATDDIHPIHLHRHSFELTGIAGQSTGGILKDVVMLGAFQEMTIDFTANQKGLSLFHCHMQNHMDLGFMALFDCR